jgi:hypothetical protein
MKKSKLLSIFFSIFLSIFLIHCKRITPFVADCHVRYEIVEQLTTAEIKVAEATAPTVFCKVNDMFFNGGAMSRVENKVAGIVYKAERNGRFPDSFKFAFERDKNNYLTDFKANWIDNPSIKDSVAHKLNGVTLYWEGEPLTKDELLTVLITDSEGTVAEAKIKGATSKKEVTIPGAMFSGLKVGKGEVLVVKTLSTNIANDNWNLSAVVDCYTRPFAVNIIE